MSVRTVFLRETNDLIQSNPTTTRKTLKTQTHTQNFNLGPWSINRSKILSISMSQESARKCVRSNIDSIALLVDVGVDDYQRQINDQQPPITHRISRVYYIHI